MRRKSGISEVIEVQAAIRTFLCTRNLPAWHFRSNPGIFQMTLTLAPTAAVQVILHSVAQIGCYKSTAPTTIPSPTQPLEIR
jgi:hypothetical protein